MDVYSDMTEPIAFTDEFDFSFAKALSALKDGRPVARVGWGNISGTWGWVLLNIEPHGSLLMRWLHRRWKDGEEEWVEVGEEYRPSTEDLLAEDWYILPEDGRYFPSLEADHPTHGYVEVEAP